MVTVIILTLNDYAVSIYLDLLCIRDNWKSKVLSDLRTNLSCITIDSLTAAEDDVVVIETDGVERGGKDLGGGVSIGTAELTGGNEIAIISAHGHQLAQHAFCRRGTHGDDDDFAAGLIFQLQGSLNGVQVVGVGDGCHGGTVQRTVRLDGHLTGGIRNLLYTNNCFHCKSCLPYFSRAPEMTIICTSLVPS